MTDVTPRRLTTPARGSGPTIRSMSASVTGEQSSDVEDASSWWIGPSHSPTSMEYPVRPSLSCGGLGRVVARRDPPEPSVLAKQVDRADVREGRHDDLEQVVQRLVVVERSGQDLAGPHQERQRLAHDTLRERGGSALHVLAGA